MRTLVLTVLMTLSTSAFAGISYTWHPDGDYDGDGLTNDEELVLGTDPWSSDTDGDGHRDPYDAEPLDATLTGVQEWCEQRLVYVAKEESWDPLTLSGADARDTSDASVDELEESCGSQIDIERALRPSLSVPDFEPEPIVYTTKTGQAQFDGTKALTEGLTGKVELEATGCMYDYLCDPSGLGNDREYLGL